MHGSNNKVKKILVATDFSQTADFALAKAVNLAKALKAELTILHVIQKPFLDKILEKMLPKEAIQSPKEMLEIRLQENIRRTSNVNINYVILSPGNPAVKILQYAKKNKYNLLVMGAHGKYSMRDSVVGTNAETVAKKTQCPVLIVKKASPKFYHKILVGTDFSIASKKALQYASHVFAKSALHLIHVGDYEYAELLKKEDIRGRMPAFKINKIRKAILLYLENKMKKFISGYRKKLGKPPYKILLGYSAPTIINEVQKRNVDLAVLGTQGHGWRHYLFMGHVANWVLTSIDKDILLVPPGKKQSQRKKKS